MKNRRKPKLPRRSATAVPPKAMLLLGSLVSKNIRPVIVDGKITIMVPGAPEHAGSELVDVLEARGYIRLDSETVAVTPNGHMAVKAWARKRLTLLSRTAPIRNAY